MNSTHKHIESGKESGIIDHIFFKSKTHSIKVKSGGIIYDAFNKNEKEIKMSRYKKEWINLLGWVQQHLKQKLVMG